MDLGRTAAGADADDPSGALDGLRWIPRSSTGTDSRFSLSASFFRRGWVST